MWDFSFKNMAKTVFLNSIFHLCGYFSFLVLTFYVDAYEIYEYILNRKEPKFRDEELIEIDSAQLAETMFDLMVYELDYEPQNC